MILTTTTNTENKTNNQSLEVRSRTNIQMYILNISQVIDNVQHNHGVTLNIQTSKLIMNLPDFKFNAAITFSSVATNTFLTAETVSKWANFNFPM
jgi:hypothetical protein